MPCYKLKHLSSPAAFVTALISEEAFISIYISVEIQISFSFGMNTRETTHHLISGANT